MGNINMCHSALQLTLSFVLLGSVFGAGLAPAMEPPNTSTQNKTALWPRSRRMPRLAHPHLPPFVRMLLWLWSALLAKNNATLSPVQSALSLSRPSPTKSVSTPTDQRISKLRLKPSLRSTPLLVSHRWSLSVTQATSSTVMVMRFTARRLLKRLATVPQNSRTTFSHKLLLSLSPPRCVLTSLWKLSE